MSKQARPQEEMRAVLQGNIPPSFTMQKVSIVCLWIDGVFPSEDFADMVNCWAAKGRLVN